MTCGARLRLMALSLIVVLPAIGSAQRATISGTVGVKGRGTPLGYAVIRTKPGGQEQFTDAEGRFTLRDVEPGRLTITATLLGYAALDTAIDVAAGADIRVRLELSLVTVVLPAVHSLATGCVHPGASSQQVGLELAVLFEQMQLNAERNRLLSRSYPFEFEIERKITRPEPALEARFIAFDTVTRGSERPWRYAPGKMLGTRDIESGVFSGKWTTITMPELADFADQSFLDSHCFAFGGLDVVNGDTVLRIDFSPAPAVKSPDISGAIFLEPKTYQLRSTLVNLVNLNKDLRARVGGQSIEAVFKEVLPGVPVLDRISSMVYPIDDPKKPGLEPSTENHRVLNVRFLRGRP